MDPICCVRQYHAAQGTFPDHRLELHLQCTEEGLPALTIVCPANTIKTKKMQNRQVTQHNKHKTINQNLHTDLTISEFSFFVKLILLRYTVLRLTYVLRCGKWQHINQF